MKTETGRRSAPVDPPAGAAYERVRLLEDIGDELCIVQARVLRYNRNAETVAEKWEDTDRIIEVTPSGCSEIDVDTECWAMAHGGMWHVVPVGC